MASCSFVIFLLISTRSGLLATIKWSVYISNFQRILRLSFSLAESGLFIYYLIVLWTKFNLLHNSQWITFPTLSCLVLYSPCASLLHLLTMWLILSSLSSHNLHLYDDDDDALLLLSLLLYYYYYYYYYYYSLWVFTAALVDGFS